jgi:hypothetical protein
MKRSRSNRQGGNSDEAENILWLAGGLAESGSKAEDTYWEQGLADALDELLSNDSEDVLTTTLENLYAVNQRAYDVLADALETRTEQFIAEDGETLLLAAPILAWSRFSIPAITLPTKVIANLRSHLQTNVLAKGVRLSIADVLFSPDQLPQGYCETAKFTRQMAPFAITEKVLHIDPKSLPETSRFLSDLRYILVAIHVPAGAPIFRWQQRDCSREQAVELWRTQATATLTPLLPGCATELVLPDAFFAACRQSDKASRPYSIRASVAFLSTTLEVEPKEIHAIVAPFYEHQMEEYRIGFTVGDRKNVVHGVVWPLLGPEDDPSEALAEIDASLKDTGLSHIEHLDSRFPMEYCDDCGAPMYPSPDGEAVHAELPEDKAEQVPKHLH